MTWGAWIHGLQEQCVFGKERSHLILWKRSVYHSSRTFSAGPSRFARSLLNPYTRKSRFGSGSPSNRRESCASLEAESAPSYREAQVQARRCLRRKRLEHSPLTIRKYFSSATTGR